MTRARQLAQVERLVALYADTEQRAVATGLRYVTGHEPGCVGAAVVEASSTKIRAAAQ